ncbi:MAG: hypothetical protein MSIBF_07315 [Candidatus Altiarchaeales archaeon IMC4]|nr:MAG: hypothetical protein MSIBF_07315 [Candidatus Altiarchaeales archaeon IMC4]
MQPKELHFIDSSIFVDAVKEGENDHKHNSAVRHLNKIRRGVFKGFTTFTVLAEVIFIVMRDVEEEKWTATLRRLLEFIKISKIKLETPEHSKFLSELNQIKHLERRFGPTDIKLLAEAVAIKPSLEKTYNKKLYFATFDTKFGTHVCDSKGVKLLDVELIN